MIKQKEEKRNPYRMIYTSSYDRGLVYLLHMWEDIKKEVPQANLHCFYGWILYDIVHKGNPARMKWKAQVQEMMRQEGITDHGRIGHEQLKEEFLKSGIWAYPCSFEEISCISAMKSQAFGSVPVVTDYAALKETVQYGVKVDVDITDSDGQEKYKKELIAMLKDPERQEKIREEMIPWAREKFLWKHVAQQWKDIFNKGNKVKILEEPMQVKSNATIAF